jgi:uncharacterized protein
MNQLKRTLFIIGGVVCVVLAFLGILLPVLPTTPFLLLATYLFARSSDRFLHWLLHNRWFGDYIRNYREGRGMPAREKAIAIVSLWLTILFTSFYFVPFWWVRVLLLAIASGVTFHLLRIKTYRRDADDPRYRRAQSFKPE